MTRAALSRVSDKGHRFRVEAVAAALDQWLHKFAL